MEADYRVGQKSGAVLCCGNVAAQLMYGGICNDSIIANFLLILTVKDFLKPVTILVKLRQTTKSVSLF